MLTIKRLEGIIPEVNLRNELHTDYEPILPLKPRENIRKRGIIGITKRTDI